MPILTKINVSLLLIVETVPWLPNWVNCCWPYPPHDQTFTTPLLEGLDPASRHNPLFEWSLIGPVLVVSQSWYWALGEELGKQYVLFPISPISLTHETEMKWNELTLQQELQRMHYLLERLNINHPCWMGGSFYHHQRDQCRRFLEVHLVRRQKRLGVGLRSS